MGTAKIERILLETIVSQLSMLVSIKRFLMLQLLKKTYATLKPKRISEIFRIINRKCDSFTLGSNSDKKQHFEELRWQYVIDINMIKVIAFLRNCESHVFGHCTMAMYYSLAKSAIMIRGIDSSLNPPKILFGLEQMKGGVTAFYLTNYLLSFIISYKHINPLVPGIR